MGDGAAPNCPVGTSVPQIRVTSCLEATSYNECIRAPRCAKILRDCHRYAMEPTLHTPATVRRCYFHAENGRRDSGSSWAGCRFGHSKSKQLTGQAGEKRKEGPLKVFKSRMRHQRQYGVPNKDSRLLSISLKSAFSILQSEVSSRCDVRKD